MCRGLNTRKLDLFKSKLFRNQEPKKLQAWFLITWAFLNSLETYCPLDNFTLRKKTRKCLFASRWGRPSPHLNAKHLLLQESCWLQLLLWPDTSSKIAPSHLPGPISSPEEGFYRVQLSFPPALDPVTQRWYHSPLPTLLHWLTGSVLARCH